MGPLIEIAHESKGLHTCVLIQDCAFLSNLRDEGGGRDFAQLQSIKGGHPRGRQSQPRVLR